MDNDTLPQVSTSENISHPPLLFSSQPLNPLPVCLDELPPSPLTISLTVETMPTFEMSFSNYVYVHPEDYIRMVSPTDISGTVVEVLNTGYKYLLSSNDRVKKGSLAFNGLQRENNYDVDKTFEIGAQIQVAVYNPSTSILHLWVDYRSKRDSVLSKAQFLQHFRTSYMGQIFRPYQSVAVSFQSFTLAVTVRHTELSDVVLFPTTQLRLFVIENPRVMFTE